MNYLIDLILQYDPYARIAIVGHYENDTSFSRVCVAQTVLADYWNIPILDMWNKTGFSQQLVPGSKSLWTQSPWNLYILNQDTNADFNRQRLYCPDGIHPHSDITGKTTELFDQYIRKFSKNASLKLKYFL